MGRPKCFKREEVLEKAIQLFWRKGFAETSLQDLEKATGVNKSGLYSEFENKDEIFLQSLKHYSETSTVLDILNKSPLGWDNIENFLLARETCSGNKGCLMTNSIRDFSVLPTKVKNVIQSHIQIVKDHLSKNIKASGSQKDPNITTELIITFNAGLSLSFNAGDVPTFKKQVKQFVEFLKN